LLSSKSIKNFEVYVRPTLFQQIRYSSIGNMTIDGLKEFLSLIDALDQGRLRGMASSPQPKASIF
jgi:hypothetical protein